MGGGVLGDDEFLGRGQLSCLLFWGRKRWSLDIEMEVSESPNDVICLAILRILYGEAGVKAGPT